MDSQTSIATKASIESLSQRVIKSGFWVFSLKITERAFSLIRLIILARILAPHDFGLMGIAMLTMATLETFSQTGFQAALIQKKENTELYLDAAWTIMIIRGFILFTILYFIAPYAAIFFKSPQAKPIIRIIGFSILFQAFTNIGVIYFRKELEFNKQFIYQLSGTLADFIVAISAAVILRSVWALVFGLLAGNAVRCFVSYLIHPYRPHLSSDLGKAKELFGFGKWVLGSSILIFLLTQGDDIFVGKLLGTTALGFYQLAYRISNMPATEITHVISQVTFPAYSKLQDNIPKLREAYLKVLQVTAFLSFPIAGLIFVLAPDFTKIFLGEKWMPMVPAMRTLCVYGILRSLAATGGPLLLAKGKPHIQTIFSSLELIIMGILIYPFTKKWGINGTSLVMCIRIGLMFIPGMYINCRLINLRYFTWFKTVVSPMIYSLDICILLIILRKLLNLNSINTFISEIIFFLLAYIFLFRFINKMNVFRIISGCLKIGNGR